MEKNYGTIPKTMELCLTMEKTMVLWKKVWYYSKLQFTIIFFLLGYVLYIYRQYTKSGSFQKVFGIYSFLYYFIKIYIKFVIAAIEYKPREISLYAVTFIGIGYIKFVYMPAIIGSVNIQVYMNKHQTFFLTRPRISRCVGVDQYFGSQYVSGYGVDTVYKWSQIQVLVET